MIDKPFQSEIKVCHQRTSDRASRLSLINAPEGRQLEDYSRSMRWRMKVWPGRMTILASCSNPIKDSSSFLVQHLRLVQVDSVPFNLISFERGSRSCRRRVSSSMPRNTRHVDGPSSFDKASGSLRILQVSISSTNRYFWGGWW